MLFPASKTAPLMQTPGYAPDHNYSKYQRWSPQGRPRGYILQSLALASKIKSLAFASKPQVLKN